MKLEMLASLKEQAERLLMVNHGQYEFSPIDFCKKQIAEAYQLNNRNPPKDVHGERVMMAMLTWLAACEWWSILGPKDEPEASDFGIFAVGGTERHKHLKVYCHDYTHYKSLPAVVDYRGSRFAKTMWESAVRRATYRNDVPAVLGVC